MAQNNINFEELDSLITECSNNTDNVFKKSYLHQYKISTQQSSNISSEIHLKKLWDMNEDSLTKKSGELTVCVKSLSQNINKSNLWRSSLSSIDPIELFYRAQPNCNICDKDTSPLGVNQFLNNKCSCNLELNKPNNEKDSPENVQPYKKQSYLGFENEHNQVDEQKPLLRPKFGRPKVPKALNPPIYPEMDFESEEEAKTHKSNVAKIMFKSAKEQLLASNPGAKRTLGASRKAQSKFVSPMIGAQEKQDCTPPDVTDERLKHIDPKMIELIESEIIDKGAPVDWEDIAGLEMAKSVIQEAVVWPLLRPDLFTGLRRPPKGILLFGPPGTGKTLIGKCVASQCNATFFSISASSLTSKWLGDAEKMVRALFAVARCHQPAVIFIDEIDSLLTQRSDSEHEATRRIKTEFLVQFDGAATGDDDRLLIVGATNRPQELDEAARRRLVKRLYIPLPETEARGQMIRNLLKSERHSLTEAEIEEVARQSAGFSGADVRALCSEAALGPVRAVPMRHLRTITTAQVRPVSMEDFQNALQRVRPSVSQDDLGQYVKWNKTYGHGV